MKTDSQDFHFDLAPRSDLRVSCKLLSQLPPLKTHKKVKRTWSTMPGSWTFTYICLEPFEILVTPEQKWLSNVFSLWRKRYGELKAAKCCPSDIRSSLYLSSFVLKLWLSVKKERLIAVTRAKKTFVQMDPPLTPTPLQKTLLTVNFVLSAAGVRLHAACCFCPTKPNNGSLLIPVLYI